MDERGPRGEDLHRGHVWIVAVSAVIGAALLYLAAIGKWPVATIASARRLAFVVVLALNALAAGLVVALFIEIAKAADRTVLTRKRVVAAVVTGLVAVGVAWLDVVVFGWVLDGEWQWLIAIGLGLLLGVVLVVPGLLRFRQNRADNQDLHRYEKIGLGLLAGLGGWLAGMAGMAIVIGVSAVAQHSGGSGFDEATPLVRGIQGEYVALGDSYSAGEGLRPFNYNTRGREADGPESNRCHRSQSAYSQIIQFRGTEPSERFVACSGAVIHDIYHDYIDETDEDGDVDEAIVDIEGEDVEKVRVHAQVRPGQVHEDVGLVTVTVGGNDMLFAKTVRFCLEQPDCLDQEFGTDEAGRRFVDYPEPQPLRDWAVATMDEVGGAYDELFPQLAESFPNARIVVVGYPFLFPDHAAGLWPDECTAVLRRVSRDERLEIRELATMFNQLIEDRATEAGLEYASPVDIWAGHEPCGEDGQYTNSINPLVGEGSFHPNEDGQLALAHVVATYLEDNPEPPAG